ncbi:MAG: hypothetical protein K0S32_4316 [Bacteroidetes bacterium]|jgi:hypothetical protein|nr:hypothetical protein [Bacteroidota bacterium]
MKKLFLCCVLLCGVTALLAQTDSLKKKKKQFYFLWGYTRAWYSTSDIHFKDLSNDYHPETGRHNYYDFTVHNAKAHDRPDFDGIKDVINITIPQFVGRVGYYFNENEGVEMNYDHTKYIVTDYQKARVTGQFNNNPFNGDTILDPNSFLHFEHSDGANFWMGNYLRKWNLFNPNENFKLSCVVKPGAGIVFPRTDVTLFGERLNNKWHVAGWIVGVESGIRMEFLKYGVFEFTGKGSYADYITCLVLGKGNGKARHQFFTGQLTATLGVKIGK